MFSLLTGLSLRARLIAIACTSAALALGYLWLRWKLAARKAATEKERADKLAETRRLEQRIAAGQAKLKDRQAKVRAEILARSGKRDHFEH